MNHFLVSVIVWTYNHVKYIEECLDGIVNQERDFELEVIVGDDFSTDGAREIISIFSRRYHFVKPILPEFNTGGNENVKRTLQAARGKYIAFIDGDDYWCDTQKLQKQVNFLEMNNDVNLCFHNVRIVGMNDDKTLAYPPDRKKYIDCFDLILGDFTHTNSTMIRNRDKLYDPIISGQLLGSDTVIFLLPLLNGGSGYFFQDVMSVYRVHEGGIFSMKSVSERYKQGVFEMDLLANYLSEKRFERPVLQAYASMYYQYSLGFAAKLELFKSIYFHFKFFVVSIKLLEVKRSIQPYYVFLRNLAKTNLISRLIYKKDQR
jgi:glycosyltransferase involved in cell wall biosynthesis